MPPNFDELRRRLRKRGTETEKQINRRLKTAAREMELWRDYRYTIISGSVEEDLEKFRQIMAAEAYLSRRLIFSGSQRRSPTDNKLSASTTADSGLSSPSSMARDCR